MSDFDRATREKEEWLEAEARNGLEFEVPAWLAVLIFVGLLIFSAIMIAGSV